MQADEGTSIVEMLVAIVIFGILSTALLALLLTSVDTTRVSKSRSVAAQLAATYVDETRAEGAVAVAPGRTEIVRTVDGTPYTLTRDAQFVARGQSSTSCSSPGNPSYLQVRVQVTWPNMGSARAVESNTVVTPSVGDVDADDGNIAVTVVDRDGSPLAGVPVTLTPGTAGGAGPTQTTTAEGCAYFAFISPGTYTASLQKAGFTDVQRRSNPATSTSVSASQTATVSMQFDESATVLLSPPADPSYPAPTDLGYTLYSTTFLNATKTLAVAPGGNPTSVANLFPVAAGYQGWAGTCNANDPGAGDRLPPAATPRGGVASLEVGMARFEVDARRLGLPLAAGWTVTATQAADPGCPSGQSFTWTAGAVGPLSGSLPYGTWTFAVSNGPGNGASSPVTLLASDTGVAQVAVNLP